MSLDRVTITGADDSVNVKQLVDLFQEFPFVEWGILASSGRMGSPRFPSAAWLNDLCETSFTHNYKMQLSLHLCGKVVRQLLMGIDEIKERALLVPFQRIQLNFHGEGSPCYPSNFFESLLAFGDKQIIFQIDGARGNVYLESILSRELGRRVDAVGLFDASGGAGVLPEKWPHPRYVLGSYWNYHGYAGGLSPDNLAEQLPLINEVAFSCRFWIDVETGIRSDNDKVFDLDKVRRFLEIAKPHIKEKSR